MDELERQAPLPRSGDRSGHAFDAHIVINSAHAWWRGETSEALYVADDISTSASLFAEVGHEQNGVYFPAG